MSGNTQALISVEDFVKQTLEQISNALVDKTVCQNHIPVTFDLGIVTVKSNTAQTYGGLGLSVASVLKLGTSGHSSKEAEQTEYNRISFTVPLVVDQTKTKVKTGVCAI